MQAWLDEVKAEHEGETIVMSVSAHPSTTAFQETIKPFEEATGVNVEFDVMEEGAMLEKQLLECGSRSNTYDIYQVAVEAVTQMARDRMHRRRSTTASRALPPSTTSKT